MKKPSDKVYLAIYGSLLSGCGREDAIENVYSRTPCKIKGRLLTSPYLDWPIFTDAPDHTDEYVAGELLQVDWSNIVGEIDRMEGYPLVCTRNLTQVILDDGTTELAYVYRPSDEVNNDLRIDPRYKLTQVPFNDWRRYLTAKGLL